MLIYQKILQAWGGMEVWKNEILRKKVSFWTIALISRYIVILKDFRMVDQVCVHVYLIKAHSIFIIASCLNTKYSLWHSVHYNSYYIALTPISIWGLLFFSNSSL